MAGWIIRKWGSIGVVSDAFRNVTSDTIVQLLGSPSSKAKNKALKQKAAEDKAKGETLVTTTPPHVDADTSVESGASSNTSHETGWVVVQQDTIPELDSSKQGAAAAGAASSTPPPSVAMQADDIERDLLLTKIISKFEGGRIKTEILSNGLMSFKLNDKARVICTSTKNESGEDCLVILEILAKHQYKRSPYVLGTKTVDQEALKKIEIVASTHPEESNTQIKMQSPITGATISGKTIIISKTQSSIAEDSDTASGFYIVNGFAGSGKTTAAQMIINKAENSGRKVLYITELEGLVSYTKNQYEDSTQDKGEGTETEEVEEVDDPTAARSAPKKEVKKAVVQAKPPKVNDGDDDCDEDCDDEDDEGANPPEVSPTKFVSYQEFARPLILEELFNKEDGARFKIWASVRGSGDAPIEEAKAKAASSPPKEAKTKQDSKDSKASKASSKNSNKSKKATEVDSTLPSDVQKLLNDSYKEDLLHNIKALYRDGTLKQIRITDAVGNVTEKNITKEDLVSYEHLISSYLSRKISDEHNFVTWFMVAPYV